MSFMFVRLRRSILVCVLALLPFSALADRVFWGCSYGEPQLLRSGQIVCRQEVRQCQKMILSCNLGQNLLFTVDDFSDYIAVSTDNQYILGLSNRGSENAFWIRDLRGNIVERKTHFS